MDYVELIASPINEDNGCGENLDDDASFQNFFFEAEGTPERYDGQSTVPAEPPDWRSVKKNAISYLAKTKDLKLLSILAQSVLNTEGITKFENCLDGLSTLISSLWTEVYPPLDEDDGDPLERISALGHLVDKSFVIDVLKDTPIVQSKVFGKVSLRLIDRAIENPSNKDSGDIDLSQIKASFKEADKEELIKNHQAIQQSIEHLQAISSFFIEQCGNEYGVNFDATTECLSNLLAAMNKFADIKVAPEPEQVAQTDDTTTNNNMDSEPLPSPIQSGSHQSLTDSGIKLTSREDVERCFDMICSYYQEYEPSSPIPILINRSKKLIHMDFIDIIKEILPDALGQITELGGIVEKEEEVEESTSQSSSTW